MKLSLIFIFSHILFSCNHPLNEKDSKVNFLKDQGFNTIVKAKNNIQEAKDTLYNVSQISNKSYILKINTIYIKDSIDNISVLFNVCVLKQELIFTINDSVIINLNYPIRLLNIVSKKNKKLTIQENNIYQISLVEGKKGWIYKISGVGVKDQSEFYGAYSPVGKLLWYSYSNFYNESDKSKRQENFGDLHKLFKTNGITEEQFNKPLNSIDVNIL